MIKSYPIKACKQPLIWREAIRQAQFRGKFLNFFLAPVFSHYFSFKNHQSALFDHLIIGSNPLISAMILKELYRISLITDNSHALKIGLLLTDEQDYWGYHAFKKTENWQSFQKTGKNIYSFEDFLKTQPFFFQDKMQHTFTLIEDNASVMNCLYDQDTDGYVLHLKDKEARIDYHHEHMPMVLKGENTLRKQYSQTLIEHFNFLSYRTEAMSKMTFPLKKTSCRDNLEPTHLLLAKKVWLSSYPEGWLNIQKTTHHENEKFTTMNYEHLLSQYAFASAKHCAKNFHDLEEQSIQDMQAGYNLEHFFYHEKRYT